MLEDDLLVNCDLYIAYGCFGRRDDDFISCSGVENRILKVDPGLVYYEEINDYFEGCRLFDKPMYDFNAARNFLQTMQSRFDQPGRPLWSKKNIDLYQNFAINHRSCGLYIKLALVDSRQDSQNSDFDTKALTVKGSQDRPTEAPVLKLVRSRR